jgi:hypothetical protein
MCGNFIIVSVNNNYKEVTMDFKEFQETRKEASSFTPPLKYEETGEVVEGYVYGGEGHYPHPEYHDGEWIDQYLHIFKYKVSDLKPDVIKAYKLKGEYAYELIIHRDDYLTDNLEELEKIIYQFCKDEGYFN